MQALRDFKRCVTLYWLSDVINRKQVLPPWIALHLPTMYWDTAPASKHLICLTGFQGTERDRVKHMIKYIGAGVSPFLFFFISNRLNNNLRFSLRLIFRNTTLS